MKLTFTILFSLISLSCFSQIASVSSGNNIEASKLNELITKINQLNDKVVILENKVLPVGSIVNSLLTLNQYQSENGDCWILANGGSLGVSDELRVITGMTSVPNAYTDGTFLRQAKSGRALGSSEGHATAQPSISFTATGSAASSGDHSHSYYSSNTTTDGANQAPNRAITDPANVASAAHTTSTNGAHTHSISAVINGGGDIETRPKNIAVNMFVKIKKNCVMP